MALPGPVSLLLLAGALAGCGSPDDAPGDPAAGAGGSPGAGAAGKGAWGAPGQGGASGRGAAGGQGGGGGVGQGGVSGSSGQRSGLTYEVGVSLSGGEFGEGKLPGEYGKDYTYPPDDEIDYFAGKKLGLIRLPFRWERLQREPLQPLDPTELGRLDHVVSHAIGRGMSVLLDPHNHARYHGKVVGSPDLPDAHLADLWSRLAAHYGGDERVFFGLMNEPMGMPTEQWLGAANAAIAAIRQAGAANVIFVPGNGYTGAHSWRSDWYGKPSAEVMLGVVDPLHNLVFEVHQYLDEDSSGTRDTCVSRTIGSERLEAFTGWLREHGLRGFLGEFAGGRNDVCDAAVGDLLRYLDGNRDVWRGWAWWGGGPWWGDYRFALDPKGGQDRPPMATLLAHLP